MIMNVPLPTFNEINGNEENIDWCNIVELKYSKTCLTQLLEDLYENVEAI